MRSTEPFLRRLKFNAFSFALTFFLSLTVSSLYPRIRDVVSWHVQYQICQAAAQGKTARVNLLLLVGANPGGFNTTFSPLHFAARYGQAETSRVLLDAGADVNAIGTWRQTPLMEAVQAGDTETVRLLLARGASVTSVDNRSGTALWHASRMHDAAITRLLMTYGGKDCRDAENALTASVEDSDEETVRALLNGGVDPRRLTATYRLIPLTEFAAQKGQPEIVSMLRAAGAR